MAVTITAANLAFRIGLESGSHVPGAQMSAQEIAAQALSAQLLAVAAGQVEEYAPNAPDQTANEATVRFAGYLAQSDFGGVRKEDAGPLSTEWTTNHASAFRNSGAEMLLTRWKVRRAGAIG